MTGGGDNVTILANPNIVAVHNAKTYTPGLTIRI